MKWKIKSIYYRVWASWYRSKLWFFDKLDGYSIVRCSNCGDMGLKKNTSIKKMTTGYMMSVCRHCEYWLYPDGD